MERIRRRVRPQPVDDLGVHVATSEYSARTVTSTFLVEPRSIPRGAVGTVSVSRSDAA